MPYTELYCHLVWGTKGRLPLLVGARANSAEGAIRAACRARRAIVHAVGVMPEHVHVAVSLPPALAPSVLAQGVKGSTGHLLNHEPGTESSPFAWQNEYGALSFSKRSLSAVVACVTNQAVHHASNDLWSMYEEIGTD